MMAFAKFIGANTTFYDIKRRRRRRMEHLTSKTEHLKWRRDKIQELSSQGQSQREIARILQIV
jgi:DNA-binding CsgD family transcriptional regulator